jgi:hypothetical protein
MSNHETNGAGGPDQRDRLTADETDTARDAVEAGATGGEPGAGAEPAEADGPRILHARARTVTGTPPANASTSSPEEAPATRVVVADSPGDDAVGGGRSTIAADRVDITRGGTIDVEAGAVHVNRGGIGAAQAESVDLQRGGIGRLVAREVTVTQGGIGAVRADHLSVRQGAVGAAMAGRFELTQGASRSILAREAHLEQAFANSIVANQVTMGPRSGALVVIARRVQGDMRVLLDWRGALAFGAALGLVIGLMRRGPQRPR